MAEATFQETRIIRLHYAPDLDTLDLWIDDPEKEALAEPYGDNVVVKLDEEGRPIGLEIISLHKLHPRDLDALPPQLRSALYKALERINGHYNQAA
ncbi:DUF2283 domain-containing protein [Pyrodictium abyssi]|uniref:DUF2283 domain-containing protein n=1 Tax=Pyrodictium abyssi TaxID=54256 RepID=A0ABM8IU75_9CREN|nr:hypothetical protein PABY_06740 [Pyrodictium abyssi]